MTRFEKRERRIRRRRCEIITRCLGAVMAVICAAACLAFLVSGHEYTPQEEKEILEGYSQEPIIRGTPDLEVVDATIDPVGCKDELIVKQSKTAKDSASDTPELDEIDDYFEMLVECAFAEAGNQPEYGIRLVVDTIGNRSGWDMAKVKETITAKYQFSCYPDGMTKWRSHITEEFIRIVADEWMAEVKADGGSNVYWFRTGHFSQYGTAWQKVGDHYFSVRSSEN